MKNRLLVTATFALVTFVLGGCVSSPAGESNAAAAEIAAQRAELARKEAALADLQQQLEAAKAELDSRDSSGSPATLNDFGSDNSGLIPPDPKPNECYARVIVYPQTAVIAERKVKKEAAERIEIIPARYETRSEKVLVKEASTRLEVVPAQYKTVQERVIVKPESTRLVVVPAVYETIEERVQVEPAITETVEIPAEYETVVETEVIPEHTEWKLLSDLGARGSATLSSSSQSADRIADYEVLETRVEDTGDLMCLVVVPEQTKTFTKQVLKKKASTATRTIREPVYKTVTKRVLKTPAMTTTVTIPAEYRMVDVVKEVKPETTREITIPAEYAEVPVRKLVRKAEEKKVAIPAEYETVTRKKTIGDLRTEWRSVLCQANSTPDDVKAVQLALNEKNACRSDSTCIKTDGKLGRQTYEAAKRFAISNGLSAGNSYVTMDVVRALGLEL